MVTFLRLVKSDYIPKIWVLCLLLIVLTGCSSHSTELVPPSETPSTISPSLTPTSLPVVTPTPINPPTISSTLTLKPSAVQNCIQIFPNPDRLAGKDYGKIIFDRDSLTTALYNKLQNPYLYEPGVNRKKTIINGLNFAVSNDRVMFAYRLKDKEKIIVSDSNGQVLSTNSIQYDDIEHWVNDGLLLHNDNSFAFLDLLSTERKRLREDFPNRYRMQGVWKGIYAEVSYDPSLTKVLYFAKDNQTDAYYFSLWDVLAEKEIVHIPQIGFADSFPAEWSLDSEQVIVYATSTDGTQTALFSIHVNGWIETLLPDGSPSFALSPDSKKLAFWAQGDNWKNWSLSVFDRETKIITDYCIKSTYFPLISPIWSPDSQNLVVYPSEDDENTIALLVDRGQNFAAQIAENAKPVGWLK